MPKKKDSPAPVRISTSFKIAEGIRDEVKLAAAKERREMWEVVEDALRAYLTKHHATK